MSYAAVREDGNSNDAEEIGALKAGIFVAVIAAAAPIPKRGSIITGTTPFQVLSAAGGFL